MMSLCGGRLGGGRTGGSRGLGAKPHSGWWRYAARQSCEGGGVGWGVALEGPRVRSGGGEGGADRAG